MQSEYITKDYFDAALQRNTQEIIKHINQGQGMQNHRLDSLEVTVKELKDITKGLDDSISRIGLVVEDYLQTRKGVITLVEELEMDHHVSLPKTSKLLA